MEASNTQLQEFKSTMDQMVQMLRVLSTDRKEDNKILQTLTSKVEHQSRLSEKLASDLADQADRIIQLESALLHLSDKVERMTTVTAYSSTKLKQEAITIKQVVKESEEGLKQEMTKQTQQVLKGNKDVKNKCDKIAEMNVSELEKATHIENSLDILKNSVKDQNKKIGEVHEELTIKGNLNSVVQGQTQVVLDQVITESQITREVIQGHRLTRSKYMCHFFVIDFDKWVGSGQNQQSRIWFIDQIDTHVKSKVKFLADNTMQIQLLAGRCPTVLGLHPKLCKGKLLQMKAKIVKQEGDGEDLILGSEKIDFNETEIGDKCDGWDTCHGVLVDTLYCEELNVRNLVNNNNILIQFELTF